MGSSSAICAALRDRYGAAGVVLRRKEHYSKQAPGSLISLTPDDVRALALARMDEVARALTTAGA